ncbi:MAG: GIY-YIG nuclease family protein [Gammaproteobacteria bacterium]|nr:GIY-YIG nuclease family protein [Gammaproteobacteria bacterium]
MSSDTIRGWYVYIVKCSDHSLYTGISTDPDKRLVVHNSGTGARYTRSRRPVKLVYTERAENRSDALRREAQIKRMTAAGKRELIVQ